MSMICCQACGAFIDSDDDPECFTRDGNGPVHCAECREEAEQERLNTSATEQAKGFGRFLNGLMGE